MAVRLTVGGVELAGMNPAKLSALRLQKIGFVFQAYNLLPVLSALENVEFILQLQGVDKQQRRERAEQALANLGLGDLGDRRPGEFLAVSSSASPLPEPLLPSRCCWSRTSPRQIWTRPPQKSCWC